MARSIRFNVLAASALVCVGLICWIAGPMKAQASESGFCGGQNVPKGKLCGGKVRPLNALYGQGQSQSVCVYPALFEDGSYPVDHSACSPGAEQGVYISLNNFWLEQPVAPIIANNGNGATVVYGIAFKP